VVALTLGAADEGIIMRSTLSLHFGSLCDLWRGLAKVEKLRVSRDACKETVFVAGPIRWLASGDLLAPPPLEDPGLYFYPSESAATLPLPRLVT
jgi:hypothetical protein